MSVVGTVGMPGSGKGEAAAVAESAGVPVVTMGDVIREACRERGLEPATHHGEVAQTLRDEGGPAAVAEASLPHVERALGEAGVDLVVVDGLRSPAETSRFRERFGDDFSVLAVEAPFETRADRLAERGRDATDADRERLRAREERELDWGMDDVIADADRRVENDGRSLAAFRDAVREVLDEVQPEAVDR
ncbi:MAG: dephospho-CoA kinase [uncultured archaeon A07HB70]|nr:MAG: dephospho-CoA kinase [uncultured archaeon A07HB70]